MGTQFYKITPEVRTVINDFMEDNDFIPEEATGKEFKATDNKPFIILNVEDDSKLNRSDRHKIHFNGQIERFNECHRFTTITGREKVTQLVNKDCKETPPEFAGRFDPVRVQILAESLFASFVNEQIPGFATTHEASIRQLKADLEKASKKPD